MLHLEFIDVDNINYGGIEVIITNQDPEWNTFNRLQCDLFVNCERKTSGRWIIEPTQARARWATPIFKLTQNIQPSVVTAKAGNAFGFIVTPYTYAPLTGSPAPKPILLK